MQDIPFFSTPIFPLVLGSIPLSPEHKDESFAVIDEYVSLGGNAIDTAHVYGPERHKLVGEYLREKGRSALIVMDKCCHPYGRNRVTREDMRSDVSESQERMGIEKTEFLVLHRDDPEVPVGAIVDWLNELKNEGRIDAFGGSNWLHSRIEAANDYAKQHGLQGFSLSSPNLALGVPNEPMWAGAYSLDLEARKWYQATQFPIFSWSSGSAGYFAGADNPDVRRVYDSEENSRRRDRAREIAKKHDVAPGQIAVAWTLNQPVNVHAIVGPRTPREVRENMSIVGHKLSSAELEYLEFGVPAAV